MVDFKKLFKAWLFDWRLKRAIKEADRKAQTHRRKYLVIIYKERPLVLSMQGIKQQIRMHRFGKGFTAEKARKLAAYEAVPKNR
ncbi:MAG: hypothetical protein IJ144_05965 [Prevotella sp.]|nr:hypothetical protein [Prevotella sp.]